MKLTTKTTKEQLVKFLGANARKVKNADKDLYDEMNYASKMLKKDEKKVTKKDLMDLSKAVIKLLGDKVNDPNNMPLKVVAEASVKKKAPKEEVVAEIEVPKKETKKKLTKKTTKKVAPKKVEEPKVKALKAIDSEKMLQLAEMFPESFEVDGVTYDRAKDINSMEDLFNALQNGEVIVFAYYWTKRHLRQFPYFNDYLGRPKEFKHDLDLATTLHVSEELKVSYQVSAYTEAVYTILPGDFEEEDGLRTAGGIEFQIYRQLIDEETTEEE